ncbi:hypothetical protein Cgig2_016237 [Carnegiea gigantea]|uniref:Transcription initiation factor TFIID subunit 15 n=1 Tax=Carnegiea gigantea TaxID=171969 RepID=A0A9Q1GLB4_9CARY|nr:hypothetical protein Cgig2_016237 [Carnegiea gigantea]
MASYSSKGAPVNGTIYVCNLPDGTDENTLAEFFGTIGLIKFMTSCIHGDALQKEKRTGRPKIWLYYDKVTNEPKGDATITYEDPHAAVAAVEWFNNKEFHGNVIGVSIAESKGKDDPVAQIIPSDFGEPVENAGEMNGAAGRGSGRGDAPGKAWKQEGDWLCPNTRCGNINWAKRTKCNICNTNKPGVSEGGVRGGRAGGYKELDEEELEETKRRRREAEEDDGEMYDEFGNLKKKFRAKTQQTDTGKVLPGSGRAGWRIEELGVAERDRERSRERLRDRDDRERSKSRDRHGWDRHRSRNQERDLDRGREYRGRDYECDRGRDHDRDRDRYRYR